MLVRGPECTVVRLIQGTAPVAVDEALTMRHLIAVRISQRRHERKRCLALLTAGPVDPLLKGTEADPFARVDEPLAKSKERHEVVEVTRKAARSINSGEPEIVVGIDW